MEEDLHKQHAERIQNMLDLLSEHCDAVQILASYPMNNGTGNTGAVFMGSGNPYAREGMARAFLDQRVMFEDESMFFLDDNDDE